MKYYFTLTTIPSRFEKIKDVIDSLIYQEIIPTKIFLHIPKKYKRHEHNINLQEKKEQFLYSLIKDEKYQNLLIINEIEIDYGSNTKFLPMLNLLNENENNTPIIMVDDDIQYDKKLASTLLELSSRYENSACCMWGVTNIDWFINRTWNCSHNKQNLFPAGFRGEIEGFIDVFEGFGGVLLKTKFFNKKEVFDIPCEEAYFCDDVWLSANVIKNGFTIVTSNKKVQNIFLQDEIDALKNHELKFTRDNKTAMLTKILFNIYS